MPVSASPDPSLEIRTSGCLAALANGVIVVGGSAGLFSLLTGRPLRLGEEWGPLLFDMAMVSAPFVVLALTGARNKLPWAVALAPTIALWGYILFEGVSYQWHPDGAGADIGLGLIVLVSPVVITAASVGVLLWQGWGAKAED